MLLRSSVNILHYLPPLRYIIVNYYYNFLQGLPGLDGTPGENGASGERVLYLRTYFKCLFLNESAFTVKFVAYFQGDVGNNGTDGAIGPPGEMGRMGEAGDKGIPGFSGEPVRLLV